MDESRAHGRPLRYAGYRSFDYLEPGVDYRPITLASEVDRVPPSRVAVTGDEERRVWELLRDHPAISLHDHLQVVPDDLTQMDAWVRDGHLGTGYRGLATSGLAAVF